MHQAKPFFKTLEILTKHKGGLLKPYVQKYLLYKPPLCCYSWFYIEGEVAVLLSAASVLRVTLGLLDLCMTRAIELPPWPARASPLLVLYFHPAGSGLQRQFIAPILKSHVPQKMSCLTMLPADILSLEVKAAPQLLCWSSVLNLVQGSVSQAAAISVGEGNILDTHVCDEWPEGKGWFWDWCPGLAFRSCSAAALLHSIKHAVYSPSFLCQSALAQGVEKEKSTVETLGSCTGL